MIALFASAWLRHAQGRMQAAVVVVGVVALVVGCAMAVQAGVLGIEIGASGEMGLELGDVSSDGIVTGKTGPDED